jgi:hypothetical protein
MLRDNCSKYAARLYKADTRVVLARAWFIPGRNTKVSFASWNGLRKAALSGHIELRLVSSRARDSIIIIPNLSSTHCVALSLPYGRMIIVLAWTWDNAIRMWSESILRAAINSVSGRLIYNLVVKRIIMARARRHWKSRLIGRWENWSRRCFIVGKGIACLIGTWSGNFIPSRLRILLAHFELRSFMPEVFWSSVMTRARICSSVSANCVRSFKLREFNVDFWILQLFIII